MVGARVKAGFIDVMVLAGRDVKGEALEARRELLEQKALPNLDEPLHYR